MDLESLAGSVLIAGTVIVYVGFGLFPSRIYTAADVQLKVKLVDTYPLRWDISQALVILGSSVSVAGLAFVTRWLQETVGAGLALLGLVVVAIGGVLWIWHLVTRITNPRGFARGELLFWPFLTYSVLTPAGLAAYGISFWLDGTIPVLGVGLLTGAIIVISLEYILKDMPPFVHYLMTLAIGLVFII